MFKEVSLNTMNWKRMAILNEKKLPNSCVTNSRNTTIIDRTQKVIQNNKYK